MRRTVLLLLILGLVAVPVAQAADMQSSHGKVRRGLKRVDSAPNLEAQLAKLYSQEELADRVYVGDEFCIACHDWGKYTRDVKHRQALRRPMAENTLIAGRGVVADYDSNGVDDFMQGLDFNEIESVFDKFKPNAPILGYGDGTYTITIGELTMPVAITQGGTGDWKQRYLLRVPVAGAMTAAATGMVFAQAADGLSNENYVSPVQYNEKTHGYVIYHSEAWYDDANMPRFGTTTTAAELSAENGRTYSKKCIGCHTTGIRELGQDPNGEWIYRPYPASLINPDRPEQYPDYDHDGIADIVNIGCEACHGPGSLHILGGGDPEFILAPSKLSTEDSNAICEQCHIRVKSVPNATHDWPRRDDVHEPWIPGVTETPLKDFYTDAAGRWPDGVHGKQHHQQYFDFYESSKPTFQFHPVKCVECHSPHTARQKHMIVTKIEDEGLEIPTSNDNNTLCLACHATHGAFEEITKEQVAEYDDNLDHIANVVAAHTNHPYAPTRTMGLSRCSKCHMPKVQKSAINYDIHAHTFEPISPEKTLAFQADGGMPNSCAVSCHSIKVNSFGFGIDPDIGTWTNYFDALTATELMKYFGPGGMWWDTDHAESMMQDAAAKAAAPGTIARIPESEMQD